MPGMARKTSKSRDVVKCPTHSFLPHISFIDCVTALIISMPASRSLLSLAPLLDAPSSRLHSPAGTATGRTHEPTGSELHTAAAAQRQTQRQPPPPHSHARHHAHGQLQTPAQPPSRPAAPSGPHINCSLISLPRLHYVAAPLPALPASPSHPHSHAEETRSVSAKSASGRGRPFPVARLSVAWESNCNAVSHALVACR